MLIADRTVSIVMWLKLFLKQLFLRIRKAANMKLKFSKKKQRSTVNFTFVEIL